MGSRLDRGFFGSWVNGNFRIDCGSLVRSSFWVDWGKGFRVVRDGDGVREVREQVSGWESSNSSGTVDVLDRVVLDVHDAILDASDGVEEAV